MHNHCMEGSAGVPSQGGFVLVAKLNATGHVLPDSPLRFEQHTQAYQVCHKELNLGKLFDA